MRTPLLITFLLAITIGVITCTQERECKSCRKVTYENGQKVDSTDEEYYCGEELEEKEGDSATVGSKTVKWECQS